MKAGELIALIEELTEGYDDYDVVIKIQETKSVSFNTSIDKVDVMCPGVIVIIGDINR